MTPSMATATPPWAAASSPGRGLQQDALTQDEAQPPIAHWKKGTRARHFLPLYHLLPVQGLAGDQGEQTSAHPISETGPRLRPLQRVLHLPGVPCSGQEAQQGQGALPISGRSPPQVRALAQKRFPSVPVLGFLLLPTHPTDVLSQGRQEKPRLLPSAWAGCEPGHSQTLGTGSPLASGTPSPARSVTASAR